MHVTSQHPSPRHNDVWSALTYRPPRSRQGRTLHFRLPLRHSLSRRSSECRSDARRFRRDEAARDAAIARALPTLIKQAPVNNMKLWGCRSRNMCCVHYLREVSRSAGAWERENFRVRERESVTRDDYYFRSTWSCQESCTELSTVASLLPRL